MADAYQPLATKYRPQRFSDVIGQEVATQTLRNAIRAGRISPAYIFSGMRGVGKTTTARLLAKCLNCRSEEGPTDEPCGTCESCTEISVGRSMDVLEIDAASNTSVDDVRALQDNLMYAPARDRYKVYIVDEVHMLSKSAFNAFLKTLEEPPEHAVFIFATTELNKIPPTVLSRCLVFEFGRVSGNAIKERLAWICGQEKITADDEALDLIVFQSEGSIRDAISALDQVINFAGGTLSYESAMQALGLIDREILKQLFDAVIEQNPGESFSAIEKVAGAGADMRLFTRQAIRHVRDLLVVKVMGKETSMLPYSMDENDLLAEQASRLSEEDLSRFMDILVKTDQDMQYSSTPQYQLEAALVKLIHSTRLVSLSDLISQLQSGELSVGETGAKPYSAQQQGPTSQPPAPKPAGPGRDSKQKLTIALNDHKLKTMLKTADVEVIGDKLRITFKSASLAMPVRKEESLQELRRAASAAFGKELAIDILPEGPAPGAESSKKKQQMTEQPAKPAGSDYDDTGDQESDETPYQAAKRMISEDESARLLFDELDLEIDNIREINGKETE